MALSLITGGSGAGKTEYIYKKVIDWSMKEPQRQFFVIVPEQSTMQGQKDIVRLHPRRGTMNIDIVSFERLAYRIFGELSLPQPEILDDTGKTMVLRKLAGEQKDQLLLFSAHLNQTGFIDEIKSMLSEFYQYGVTPEALKEQMEKGDMGQVLPGVPGIYAGTVYYGGGAAGRAVPGGGALQAFKGQRSGPGRLYGLYSGPVPASGPAP